LKIQKYNTIYFYAYLYDIQIEESFNEDVVFYTIGEATQYKVFKNILNKNPIKFKISQFYRYKILENDIDIENIYFKNYISKGDIIDVIINYDYKTSLLYTNINLFKQKENIRYILNNLSNYQFIRTDIELCEYYKNIKNELILKYIPLIKNIDNIKMLCDEITIEYHKYNINYYEVYLKNYNEYEFLI
jgi:hypothetical protein